LAILTGHEKKTYKIVLKHDNLKHIVVAHSPFGCHHSSEAVDWEAVVRGKLSY